MSISTNIGILGAVGLVGLITFATVEHGQAVKYRKLDAEHRACVAALLPNNIVDPGRLCDPAISNDHAAAVMAKACDDALSAKPENIAAARMVCSTPVKTVVTARDVALGERDAARSDLQAARKDQAAAITRAETRVRTETQRKADAAAALARAPRDADGLVVCDAVCLRQRAGGS
ncbi:hypothetical protein [Caulobacter soli]|uniref:hypothetical protein n=1 Tax=Caulobacter soli TaxID=2708539 RepID=UPI0013EE3E56|nr:hypothetical protein [Caulobacter soli]